MTHHKRTLLAVAAMALFAALFLWRILASQDPKNYGFASADLFLYYYPVYDEIYARVRAGVLPRWNPWQLCGTPWLAALQAGLYYPGHLVYLVLPTHIGMACSGIAHLLLAAVGTYAFARRAGLGLLGALAAGIAFGFRGSIVYCLQGPNLQEAAAWIGVGALGAIMLAERRDARGFAILATATAMSLLAGYPQHTLYLLYAWASLWLVWTLAQRPAASALVMSGGAFAGALAAGALVAAAQLLPTAEVVIAASRNAAPLPAGAVSPMGSYAAQVLLTMPFVGNPLSFSIVALALAGAATIGGRPRALAWWSLALAVVAAVFALGEATRWFWLQRHLPGMALFRGPDRILLLADFGVAMAAGTALDALSRGRQRERRTRSQTALDLLPLLGAAWLAATYVRQGTSGAVLTLAGLAVGAALQTTLPAGRSARVIAGVVLGVLAGELLIHGDMRLVFPYTAERVAWFESYDPAYRQLAAADPHGRMWMLRSLDPPLASKHATRHHLRSIEDYEPVNLRRQNQYLTFLGEGVVTDFVDGLAFIGSIPHGMRPGANGTSPGTRRRLLDLAGVSRIVMTPDAFRRPPVQQFVTASGLLGNQPGVPFTVVPNPHALPRAWVVHRTAEAPPVADLLPLLADPAFDPLALAYVEGDPGFTPAEDAPARGEPARFVTDDEDVVEVETTAPAAGLLVLADTYASGWHATVDGTSAPIVATNQLFRGVPVPAGTHRVRFTYRPWTIPAGQGLSLVGIALLAAIVLRGRHGRVA